MFFVILQKLFKDKEDLELTTGTIWKDLFYLSLPIVIINLLRTAYNIADTFWVAQLAGEVGKNSLAAITFGFPLVFFFISLGLGLAVAGSVLVAQYEGRKNREMVDKAASQTITFGSIAAITLGTIGFFLVEEIVKLLGAKPDVVPLASSYMQVITLGLVFLFGFSMFIALMRGYGDTITPMLLMLGSVALNIVLDPFLIFGWWIFPKMGIEGAAYATIFCRGLAFLAGIAILFSGKRGVKISWRNMVPDRGFLKKMLGIGIPASIDGVGRSISVNLVLAIVGTFSTAVVAGFGISIRIFSMIFLPAIAIGKGVETMTGQNVGVEKYGRAEKTNYIAAKFMFILLTLVGSITFIFAEPIAGVFADKPEVLNVGTEFLRYVSFTFGFIGVIRAFSGGFRGSGKTLIAAAISISFLGLTRVPLAFFGSGLFGPEGVWMAFAASNVLGGLIAFLWFRKGTWKQNVVNDKDHGFVVEKLYELNSTVRETISKLLSFRNS
ncbi:MAG: MATE family efflux transporter [Nanohaloarchaea archaeon]|nr:MATE family efflux transporter [Candidatus Nanohaloarchaea archaeon]